VRGQALRARLEEVQRLLGEPTDALPVVPELDEDEVPERRNESTKELLLAFKVEYAEQLRREREANAKAQAGGFGGFGGFGGGGAGAGANDDTEVR
jgi:hypothetical protein